jgi:hypothetical protein
MIRTMFAIAIAALLFVAVSGVSRAAPIAPLAPGVANDAASGNVTQVWCRWGRCGWGPGWGYRRWGWGGGWCRWHPYRCGW